MDSELSVKMRIGGRSVAAAGSRTFHRSDPYKGDVVSIAPAGDVRDALASVEAARSAFPGWAASSPRVRRDVLLRYAALLHSHESALIELMVSETGGTVAWAHFNVELAASFALEAAAQVYAPMGEVLPTDQPGVR